MKLGGQMEDAALDVRSDSFDPVRALNGRAILPRKVFPLENLDKARALLPQNHPDAMDPAFLQRLVKSSSTSGPGVKEKRKKEKIDVWKNPLDELVKGFDEEGPFSLLRKMALEKARIRVATRRVDGFRGSCVGILRAFDRHMNLLMYDVLEDYTVMEYANVSSDGYKSTLESKLTTFFSLYNPEKASTVAQVCDKYREKQRELWQFLYTKYGLLDRVAEKLQIKSGGNADHSEEKKEALLMLLRFSGREPRLMEKLGIATEVEKAAAKTMLQGAAVFTHECIVHAEWIQKESVKYPGRFFFYNTKTKASRWEPPDGITFKTVQYLAHKQRHLGQLLIRGDCVIYCSYAP